MRLLACGLVCLLSIQRVSAQDAEQMKVWAEAIKPERLKLIACLSDFVDRSKAQKMPDEDFKRALPKACLVEFEELQKAFLARIPTPGVEGAQREELVVGAIRMLFVPVYNEFSGHFPYRYSLKDAVNRAGPTPEDIALKSAKEKYSGCLAQAAADARKASMSAEHFKNSLSNVCTAQADAVHLAELSVWDTYARPPSNRDAAGKRAIAIAKMNAVKQYTDGSK